MRPRRRRRTVALVGLVVVGVVVVVGGALTLVVQDQPSFAYTGPEGPVRAGEEVTIHANPSDCGPLIVTLHEEGAFGLWDQTHSGNVVSGFAPDRRPWWHLGGSTFTPVPCATGGASTFTLPVDFDPGVLAACDQDGRCARVEVEA